MNRVTSVEERVWQHDARKREEARLAQWRSQARQAERARERRALLRRLEEADPEFQRRQYDELRRNAKANYQVLKQAQAAGQRVPRELIRSILRDVEAVEGLEPLVARETARMGGKL